MPQEEKTRPKKKALGAVGTVIGIAIGWYSGIHLLIPLIATGLVWWGGKNLLSEPKRAFLPAAAVQAGHLVWLAFSLIVVGVLSATAVDVLLLLIGVTWLLVKPGLGPVILLTLYQSVVLLINGVRFLDAPLGTAPHKALLIHIIWRISALVLMWQAWAKSRRSGTL